jgi:hypothetical protein
MITWINTKWALHGMAIWDTTSNSANHPSCLCPITTKRNPWADVQSIGHVNFIATEQYASFCTWLLLLNILFVRSLHVMWGCSLPLAISYIVCYDVICTISCHVTYVMESEVLAILVLTHTWIVPSWVHGEWSYGHSRTHLLVHLSSPSLLGCGMYIWTIEGEKAKQFLQVP